MAQAQRDVLLSLPDEVLRYYVRFRGLELSESADRDEILGKILADDPEELSRLLTHRTRLEGEYDVSRVAKTLQRASGSLGRMQTWFLRGALAAATIVALLVLIGALSFKGLRQKEKELRQAKDDTFELLGVLEGEVLDQAVLGILDYFDGFSLSAIGTEKLKRRLVLRENSFRDLAAAERDDPEASRLTELVLRLDQALLALANADTAESMEEARNLWLQLTQEEMDFGERYSDLMAQIPAYCRVVLGLTQFRLYRLSDDPSLLDAAEQSLNEAVSMDGSIGQAHNYLGVVAHYRFDTTAKGSTAARQLLLEKERGHYDAALAAELTASQLAVVRNNYADSYMEEATWLDGLDRRLEAREAVKQAERWIDSALIAEAPPATFVTAAQIKCTAASLDPENKATRVRYEDILARLRGAIAREFTGYQRFTRASFLERRPVFRCLESFGEEGWQDDLYDALAISD